MDKLSTLVAALDFPLLALVICVFLALYFLASTLLSGAFSANLPPLIGTEYGNAEQRRQAFLSNAWEIFNRGYNQFKTRVFRITTTDGKTQRNTYRAHCLTQVLGEQYIVPRTMLPEFRALPKGALSARRAVTQVNPRAFGTLAENTLLTKRQLAESGYLKVVSGENKETHFLFSLIRQDLTRNLGALKLQHDSFRR